MQAMIESANLSKDYQGHLALDQVDFHVYPGDIYGLIGRNGAGKTTLMKIINRQIHHQGKLFIQGKELSAKDSHSLRIGSLIEVPGFYPNLSAYENLNLKCILYGIRRPGYIEELLSLVQLSQAGKKKAKNFSLGMKQRLGLALALVGDPDILLLDEPTNGMDPQGIVDFRQIIQRLNIEKDITVIVSSHILGELAKLVNRIGIIDQGRLIKEASMEQLKIENQDHITITGNHLSQVVAHLEEHFNLKNYTMVTPTELHIFEYMNQAPMLAHQLIRSAILFDSFTVDQASLEDYFMKMTGGQDHA